MDLVKLPSFGRQPSVTDLSAFYNYLYEQNEMIANGTNQGIQLNFNTLGVGNGIINEYI